MRIWKEKRTKLVSRNSPAETEENPEASARMADRVSKLIQPEKYMFKIFTPTCEVFGRFNVDINVLFSECG
jgi:hypothetical protein